MSKKHSSRSEKDANEMKQQKHGGWYCSDDTMINLMFAMNEWVQMEERKMKKMKEWKRER